MDQRSDETRIIGDLLRRYGDGEQAAFDELCRRIYPQLKLMARARRPRPASPDALGATTIVHEAFLKLAGGQAGWKDKQHFLAVAATAMRQVILDHLRSLATHKRQRQRSDDTLSAFVDGESWTVEMLAALEQGLLALAESSADSLRVFECKYFAGYSTTETAEALGMSGRTVERLWTQSRAFLQDYVAPSSSG